MNPQRKIHAPSRVDSYCIESNARRMTCSCFGRWVATASLLCTKQGRRLAKSRGGREQLVRTGFDASTLQHSTSQHQRKHIMSFVSGLELYGLSPENPQVCSANYASCAILNPTRFDWVGEIYSASYESVRHSVLNSLCQQFGGIQSGCLKQNEDFGRSMELEDWSEVATLPGQWS